MAWDNGSITSDTPGAALSDKLKTLVGSTSNWSFVENAPAADTWPSGVGCIRGLLKEDVLALYLPSPNVWDTTTVGAQSDWTVIVGGGYCYLGAGISSYSTITRAV